MTGPSRWLVIAAAATAVASLTLTATAHDRGLGRGDDPAFHRGQNRIDPHVRYPGDESYDFGNYRQRGPDKGPYIERCWWVANNTFFGLPLGFTQKCVRYTNQNTN